MLWIKLHFDHLVSLNDITGISRGLSVTSDNNGNHQYENGRAIYLHDKNGGKLFTFYKDDERAKEVFDDLIKWISISEFTKQLMKNLTTLDMGEEITLEQMKKLSCVYTLPKE